MKKRFDFFWWNAAKLWESTFSSNQTFKIIEVLRLSSSKKLWNRSSVWQIVTLDNLFTDFKKEKKMIKNFCMRWSKPLIFFFFLITVYCKILPTQTHSLLCFLTSSYLIFYLLKHKKDMMVNFCWNRIEANKSGGIYFMNIRTFYSNLANWSLSKKLYYSTKTILFPLFFSHCKSGNLLKVYRYKKWPKAPIRDT